MSGAKTAAIVALLGSACAPPDASQADAGGSDTTTTGDGGSSSSGSTGEVPANCNGRALRLAAYNIEGVGDVGSASYQATLSVLKRIDADVACVEEINDGEGVAFGQLAMDAGYDFVLKADRSPAIGGEISNGCMSRLPMSLVGSWGSTDLSEDSAANDMGRDFLVVRIDASQDGAPCRLGVFGLHLKSGQESPDWFRRQVETERLVTARARYREHHPGDPQVVMGDFNENLDDTALGTAYTQAPAGLPGTFALGSDIGFPLVYQPFARLTGDGLMMTSPGQEDAPSFHDTWRDSIRLDYVLLSQGIELAASEVYNACRDNGVDDPPAGDDIDKAGDPLPCNTSSVASDHFPVVVDVVLP